MGIRKEDYQKFNFFFMELSMRNKKGRELVASLFSGYEICTEFFSVPFLTSPETIKLRTRRSTISKIWGEIKGAF